MRYQLIITFITLLTACASADVKPESEKLSGNIEQQQLLNMQSSNEDFLLLDVRSKEEFEQGHIVGAQNISHDELSSKLESITHFKDKNIVVYCRSGRRAGMAIDVLKENDFKHLSHLSGDMQEWQKANLAISQH